MMMEMYELVEMLILRKGDNNQQLKYLEDKCYEDSEIGRINRAEDRQKVICLKCENKLIEEILKGLFSIYKN